MGFGKENDVTHLKREELCVRSYKKKPSPKLMKIIFEMKHEIEDHLLSLCRSFGSHVIKSSTQFLYLATNYAIDIDAKKALQMRKRVEMKKKMMKKTPTQRIHTHTSNTPTRSFVINRELHAYSAHTKTIASHTKNETNE